MAVLYGVLSMKDLASQRVTEVGVDVVVDSIEQTRREHERALNALVALFALPTTNFKTRFKSSSAHRLQPLDNAGRALPVKPLNVYDVAFPLQQAGTAYGFDDVTEKKITLQEVAQVVSSIMDADARWMRDHILAALFHHDGTNGWTWPDEEHGDLTVYGLANGDAQSYQIMSGADADATDDHLLGSATLTAGVFQNIYDELIEHPENGEGEIVTLIAPNLKSTAEGLTGFAEIEDDDVRPATSRDVLTGELTQAVPGTVLGKIERQWVVEWKGLPSNYVLSVATGGDKPLRQREDPEPELRGFVEVAKRENHPWYETQYRRRAGFGAWNRVGAVAYFIDGGAAFATPSGYESPQP